MSKKVKIIIAVVIGVLILAVAGILLFTKSGVYNEKLAENDLRAMAEEFYGYYYDDNNTEKKAAKFVEQFKETGLSITLGDLKIYLEGRNSGKKYDSKNLEKCDVSKTKVTMYPKSPFGKKDIDMKIDLSCK